MISCWGERPAAGEAQLLDPEGQKGRRSCPWQEPEGREEHAGQTHLSLAVHPAPCAGSLTHIAPFIHGTPGSWGFTEGDADLAPFQVYNHQRQEGKCTVSFQRNQKTQASRICHFLVLLAMQIVSGQTHVG